nr:unnamed protein product [Spirometra erinaceieuropaei]
MPIQICILSLSVPTTAAAAAAATAAAATTTATTTITIETDSETADLSYPHCLPASSTNTTLSPVSSTNEATPDVRPTATFTTTAPTISSADSISACKHCDRTFLSRIGVVGHSGIHRNVTGTSAPGVPVAVRVSSPSAFVTLPSCPPHTPCRYAAGTRECSKSINAVPTLIGWRD